MVSSRKYGLGFDPGGRHRSSRDHRAVLRAPDVVPRIPVRIQSGLSTSARNPVPPLKSHSMSSTNRRGKKQEVEPRQDPELAPPRKSDPNFDDWDTAISICTLNVFCRRTSQGRYVGHQIRAIDTRPYDDDRAIKILRKEPELVHNDRRFFEELNFAYYTHVCGFWRRWCSLKTLRTFQLVKFTRGRSARLETVELAPDAFFEMLAYFHRPWDLSETDYDYVDWVFHLRQDNARHSLEFIESWSGWRVAIAGSIPGVISTGVAMVWALKGGELSTVFTVAGFILASSALIAALFGFIIQTER